MRCTYDAFGWWGSLVLIGPAFFAWAHAAAANPTLPWSFELTPKASGMKGLQNVYSLDVTVGRIGPLSLLVDTGSPAVVVQGDFEDTAAASSNFLGTDKAGSSTIHYGGSTVSGAVSRSRLCFDHAIESKSPGSSAAACISNFPVFEVTQKDSGFSQLGLDGVLGLGPASGESNLGLTGMDQTLLEGLANAGVGAAQVFGLYISPGPFFGPSELSLGGYDTTKILQGAELQFIQLAQPASGRWELPVQSLKLAPADGSAPQAVDVCQGRGDCRALLDSGTSQLPSVPQLNDALGRMVRDAETGDCKKLDVMPDILIEFAGGAVFKLGPENYVLDRGMCSLAVEEMSTEELSRQKNLALILGEPFFRRVYAVFDKGQDRVGLAPSVASGLKTRNEERREEAKEEKAEHGLDTLMNYVAGR